MVLTLSFDHIRPNPEFAICQKAPMLTKLTGIPTCSEVLPPATPCNPSDLPRGRLYIFTDGSANLPGFPKVCRSSWAFVFSSTYLGNFQTGLSGIVPGNIHDICRAETFAVYMAIASSQQCHTYCDNSSVVATFRHIQNHCWDGFKWRSHPNQDL